MRTEAGRLVRLTRQLILMAACLPLLAVAHGPMPRPELEWRPGELLIKIGDAAGIESALQDNPNRISKPGLEALFKKAKVQESRLVFPHYREASSGATLHRSPKVTMGLESGLGQWLLLTVPSDSNISELVQQFKALPEVQVAEPNYVFRLVGSQDFPASIRSRSGHGLEAGVIPNDPEFSQQWGLTYINAPEAWEIEQGSPDQVIAVIDTGVDLDHPDLINNIWTNPFEVEGDANGDGCPGICGVDDDGDGLIDEDGAGLQQPFDAGWDSSFASDDDENGYIDDIFGWDWVGDDGQSEDNDPQDNNGHGTHVAGIAAADTNNGIGGAGVCPNCSIMSLKVFKPDGTAGFSDIAKSVEYAWRNGASVINMSFASLGDSSLVREALQLASTESVLVSAAGNSASERSEPASDSCSSIVAPFYPAHYDFVLGVEALAQARESGIVGFSNCEYEVQAPGENIFSTMLDDSYATWSGTSMAAPMVSGTAALVRANQIANPEWTPNLVFGQLIQSQANALDALTLVPEPSLDIVEFEIIDDCNNCDVDGIPDSGETVKLVLTLRNLWSDAIGVSGVLSSDDSLIYVENNVAAWGDISAGDYGRNTSNPFVVEIDPATNNDYEVVFDLTITNANGGEELQQKIKINVQRGLNKSGLMTSNEIWTDGNLYVISGILRVPDGVQLTIQPGTEVQFELGASLRIEGELIARGTAKERVVFFGPDDGVPDPGPQNGGDVSLEEASPTVLNEFGEYVSGSVLEYCEIRNSFGRITLVQNLISKCIIKNSEDGIYAVDSKVYSNLITDVGISSPVLHAVVGTEMFGNTVVGNRSSGVQMDEEDVTIEQSNLFQNDGYSLALGYARGLTHDASNNYWGTTDETVIDEAIYDSKDDVFHATVTYQPVLEVPNLDSPIVVHNIDLDPPSPVGAERITVTVTFSRDVADTSRNPLVLFGSTESIPGSPIEQNGNWLDDRTWQGQVDITIFSGDGQQTITVSDVEDLEGFPLPENDFRFGFEIATAGTVAKGLNGQGTGGGIQLTWGSAEAAALQSAENQFSLSVVDLAGYNVYRSDSIDGSFEKINSAIVVDNFYTDFNVSPGETYFYKVTVVTTDLLESSPSNTVAATTLDSDPPQINHEPPSSAPSNQILTLIATITDTSEVSAKVFFRSLNSEDEYAEIPMINSSGDRFTANVPADQMTSPGIEYYLEASDGENVARHGSPESPNIVLVASNEFRINSGLNDAWANPDTLGQGLLITVLPSYELMFIAMFTFDVERPAEGTPFVIGEPGHRWITALGPYSGNIASLDLEITEGGVFNSSELPAQSFDGYMQFEFSDCQNAIISYSIESLGLEGEIPIQRLADDNVVLCEELSGTGQ